MKDNSTLMDSNVDFDLSDPSIYHDRVFIVGHEKFYVVAGIVSLWSQHFRRMFEGNVVEATNKEIEIKEVEARIFEKYLFILYKNTCDLNAANLTPMIHLSYRFLTPHVLDFCKKYVNANITELDSLMMDLLKTACVYDIKDLKNTLTNHLMNDTVIEKFNLGEVVDIVAEYKLEDLKAWLGEHMSKNVNLENCIELLEASAKFNMPTLKVGINNKIGQLVVYIPSRRIIELTVAAFKHDVNTLKDKLHSRIYTDTLLRAVDPTHKNYLVQNYSQIKALPENVMDFIILASHNR